MTLPCNHRCHRAPPNDVVYRPLSILRPRASPSRVYLSPLLTFGENACHPEPFASTSLRSRASAQGKLREGSSSTDAEILRSPTINRGATDDSQDTAQV